MLVLLVAAAAQQRVLCDTTAGQPPRRRQGRNSKGSREPSSSIFRPFTILLNASLAPLGVRRVSKLVRTGFLDGQILYRVIPGFLVQFGVAADPTVHARWQRGEKRRLKDEPNRMPFRHGTLSFAGAGTDSRTSHLFVALAPNGVRLGRGTPHEATLGHVVSGMETWERVVANYQKSGYKDTGTLQGPLVQRGNAAAAAYPLLDRIRACHMEVAPRRRLAGSPSTEEFSL